MEKYQFNDQVVDGMSLVLWRRANFAGDVVRIDREYNIGQCIESIMRFEIIFWYKNQFDRMAQEVRKATSDLKTGTETNKDFLGDIERQITDIEQRIDKEITEAEGKFVPYLPKFYDIRMPKQQRPKENPDSGGTAQVFTDDSSAFPIHPK
jgi:hypothetical protein